MSQAALRLTPRVAGLRPTTTGRAALFLLQQQQTRGMKVHSSVKKRCEHCKVSPGKGTVTLWLCDSHVDLRYDTVHTTRQKC